MSARKSLIYGVNKFRVRKALRHPMPKWITLFITNYCNARCEHCFYWHELNSKVLELNVDEYERVFQTLNSRLRTIRLSGGEPFLRKDISEFYLTMDRLNKTDKISIPTHGMLEIIPSIERMLGESLNRTALNVSVSLDGLEETHNSFRGIRNGFAKAV